jgi:hypothetical protein
MTCNPRFSYDFWFSIFKSILKEVATRWVKIRWTASQSTDDVVLGIQVSMLAGSAVAKLLISGHTHNCQRSRSKDKSEKQFNKYRPSRYGHILLNINSD